MKKLEDVLADIRNTEPLDRDVEAAAERTRAKLFSHASAIPDRIRGCADYQALITPYLNRTLSAGRSLLLQDHTRECVACRNALAAARSQNKPTLIRPATPPSHHISPFWAVAAAAVVLLGTGTWFIARNFIGGSGRTTVQNVSGVLYAVTTHGTTPIFSGREVRTGEHVRTGKQSTAVIRLGDGSLVEMNERSEFYVNYAATGATVHLDRGDIIVQAAKQKRGTLDVITPDCLVSVKGTVFSVNRGTKGSRVSVIEGSVKVAQGSQSQMLKPGDQVSTDASLQKVPVRNTIEWSRDSSRYVALLSEFSHIQKQLEQMPSPALRYEGRLLKYVPDNAVMYAAMPNLGSTVAEANRLLRERLHENEVLRTWWEEQNNGAKLDTVLARVRELSDYLGDEIVMTIGGDWEGNYTPPMILAEVKKPGLRAYVETELRNLGASAEGGPQVSELKVSNAPVRRYRARPRGQALEQTPMQIAVSDNLMVVAWTQEQIDYVASRLEDSNPPHGRLVSSVESTYASGVNWLFCVDMEQITRNTVSRSKRNENRQIPNGLDGMKYLIVERKDIGGQTSNTATLDFAGNRHGMANWLAEPSSMGTLDFVSPDALFSVSMALREPGMMLNDVFRYLRAQDPNFDQELDSVQSKTNVQLNDLARGLGGEFTFAIDGTLIPLPSWKLAIEVYDPYVVQTNIQRMIDAFNTQSQCPDCKMQLTKQTSGSQTIYTLQSQKVAYTVYYTYVDGYLLFAPDQIILTRAIQNRQTGYVLSRSDAFRSQLPRDGSMNFSALIFHNLGSALQPIAKQLGNSPAVSPSQRASIQALANDAAPGLIYAYGEESRIRVASSGSFFGLNLNNIALPQLIGQGFHTSRTIRN